MQKRRFFIPILFLLLFACSSKDWEAASPEVVDLSIRGDALHFSKGFSISLIEGAVPEKTVNGSETTVSWKQGQIELSLQFSGKSPEVKLLSNFDVKATELASISGRMMSDTAVVANFGGRDLALSQNLLRSPSGKGALHIEGLMQLHLPFLYSIQKSEKATRWRYVDAVALGCNITGTSSVGHLRLGLPRVDILHRAPKLSVQIVTLISDDETEEAILSQKINTIMNGHSRTDDPRFGNGGLSTAEGSSSFLGKGPTTVPNVSFIDAHDDKNCKASGLGHLKGDADMLYFPGVGYIARSEKTTSRIFRNASLQKMRTSQQTTLVHLGLDETLLIKEGDDWTLSKRSALDFADLELFAEDGKIEVLGATSYFNRLNNLSKVSWSWSPKGTLRFECPGCDSTKVVVRIENMGEMSIPKKDPLLFNLLKPDVLEWNLENEQVFNYQEYRPQGIDWRFGIKK